MAPMRVLIVDDSRAIRQSMRMALRIYPEITVVGEASSGAAAIELVEQLAPDLVLIDLTMPGMSGTTTIAALRAQHPTLPLVALASFEEDELGEEALCCGASAWRPKSVNLKALAALIYTLCQRLGDIV